MDADNKLKIVPVTVLYRNQLDTVIQATAPAVIEEGDLLVLNDLLPAIEGMSLSASALKIEDELNVNGSPL
jgi:hypothetical protein